MTEMMEKPVMIRVTSMQHDGKGEPEKISLETPGNFGMKKGIPYISYEETALTGMEGTTTSIYMYPDSVSLVRTGTFLQTQEYCPGEVTGSRYETPMGSLEMVVSTKEIQNTICDGNGKLHIVYEVELEGVFFHRNELVIDVWEDPVTYGSKRTTEKHH